MEDSSVYKRPRSRPQEVSLPKRHNTRSTSRGCTATCSNRIPTPIRIHPPTHSLYFLRIHKLFFHEEKNESEDGNQNLMVSVASSTNSYTPRIVRFGNVRLQSIYQSPNLYIIDQFLSATDIQHLFTHFISKFKFQRSFVDEGGDDEKGNHEDEDDHIAFSNTASQQPVKSSHRTSTFLALNKQHDSRIASIEHKVASLFGCTTQQIEALQLVRYQEPEQCFHVHHDLGVYDETTGEVELPNKSIWYHRRMITLFCYLNTVPPKNGGATYFPCCVKQHAQECLVLDEVMPTQSIKRTASIVEARNSESESQNSLGIDPDYTAQGHISCVGNSADRTIVCDYNGLRIFPVAGRAVAFSNVLSSGVPDPRTIHAGEPVIVSRDDNVKKKLKPDKKYISPGSLSKSDAHNYSTTKYGLNIWICEN